MEDLKEDIQYLNNEGKEYVQSELRLAKLELVETVSDHSSDLLSRFILSLIGVSSYLVLLIALGLYFAEQFGSVWMGIAASGAISLLVLIGAFVFKKHVLQIPIQNALIRTLSKQFTL